MESCCIFFCNLHIISFALRYHENSHGISKFKSFPTCSMTFILDNIHFLAHNKSWKFLWWFEIQTVCHFLYDFWVAWTIYILLGFKLDYLHFREPLFVFFLTFIFFFLQRNRGNLYGISKFKSFATWSYFSLELHVPTTVLLVLQYSILNSGKPLYLTFCNLRILSFALRYRENSHGILTFR